MKLSLSLRLVFGLLPRSTALYLGFLTFIRIMSGLLDAVFVYLAIDLAKQGLEAVLSPSVNQILIASGLVIARTAVFVAITLFQDSSLGKAEVLIVEKLLAMEIEMGRSSSLAGDISNPSLVYTTSAHTAIMHLLSAVSVCVSESMALVGVLMVMSMFDPLAPLVLGAAIMISFWLVKSAINNRLQDLSSKFQQHQLERMNLIDSISKIRRELRTSNSQSYFLERHSKEHNSQVRHSRTLNVLVAIPRIVLDVGLILVICLLVIWNALVVRSDNFVSSLVLIAASAYRVMPAATAVVTSLGVVRRALGESQLFFDEVTRQRVEKLKLQNMATETGRHNDGFSDKPEIVQFSNVTYRNTRDELILDRFDLTINRGDRILIRGNSGVGKSTIFDLMIGEASPLEGTVLVFGLPPAEAVRHLPRKIGIVPQDPQVVPGDLFSNVILNSRNGVDAESQVSDLMHRLGLHTGTSEKNSVDDNSSSKSKLSLSGGEVQRIAIARVLYQRPELIILDEPTSALDPENRQLVLDLISELGATVIIISHEDVYQEWATRQIMLSR